MEDEIRYNKLVLLGKLAAGLAHEVRNPLSVLKLNLNYLKMSDENFSLETNESLAECLEAAERIQHIIENTLEFSKTSTKDFNFYSLNKIVQKAFELVQAAARRKNIKLESHLEIEIPQLYISRNKILQVILNLVTNAIEASADNSVVKVKTYVCADNFVTFEVEDYGVGIKDENKDKIFDEFFTDKEQGTGIGLTVCEMLLKEHNAKMYFDSIEGEGTSFFVKFPPKLTEGRE